MHWNVFCFIWHIKYFVCERTIKKWYYWYHQYIYFAFITRNLKFRVYSYPLLNDFSKVHDPRSDISNYDFLIVFKLCIILLFIFEQKIISMCFQTFNDIFVSSSSRWSNPKSFMGVVLSIITLLFFFEVKTWSDFNIFECSSATFLVFNFDY